MATTATFIMTSQAAAILDFKFSHFFIIELNTENGEKTAFSNWNLQNVRSIVKMSVFSHSNFQQKEPLFNKKLNFHSQHTSYVLV